MTWRISPEPSLAFPLVGPGDAGHRPIRTCASIHAYVSRQPLFQRDLRLPAEHLRGAACCRSCGRARPAARRRASSRCALPATSATMSASWLIVTIRSWPRFSGSAIVRAHQLDRCPRRSRRCSRTSASARRRPRSRSRLAGQLGDRDLAAHAPPAPSRGRRPRCRSGPKMLWKRTIRVSIP